MRRTLFAILLMVPGFVSAQPNMIFVLVDDLRFDGIGHVNPALSTPNIDRLAEEGAFFSRAVVTTSLCSPSRATILTGQTTRNHRIVDNNDASEAHLTFFPKYLQEAGYTTAFVGKWHMGRANDDPRPGFDYWVSFKGQGFYDPTDRIPQERADQGVRHQINVNGQHVDQRGYMTDELNRYALDWLATQDDDQPFFLYLSHKAVHSDAKPADRHRGLYSDTDIRMPDPDGDRDQPGVGKPMWVHNQRNSWHGVDFPYHSEQDFAAYVKRYYATLAAVDDGIGEMLELLERQGLIDNTLVVFFSDNGFLFGDHGLIDKRNAYEASVRVPMAVFGPGLFEGGVTVDERVRNLDLAPTFLEFAGVDMPSHFEGQSFKPLMTGEESAWAPTPFVYEYYWEWTFPHTPTTFAITDDEVKYIQYHGIWDLEELYDLRQDPQERVNLLEDERYRNRLIDLRAALYEELQNNDGLRVVPFTEKRAQGIRFRSSNGSKSAKFPSGFVKSPRDPDLFDGFFPPERVQSEE